MSLGFTRTRVTNCAVHIVHDLQVAKQSEKSQSIASGCRWHVVRHDFAGYVNVPYSCDLPEQSDCAKCYEES